jgi:hypothetical protein
LLGPVDAMDPLNPADAQQVVIEYARMLERDIAENRHPARIDSLPFAKPVIQTAIRTSVGELAQSGRLTEDLRVYFETAYTSLAEYLEGELVDLLTEFQRSAEQLTHEAVAAGEKTRSAAWRTVAESGALAGEVARATTQEAERLRAEFRQFAAPV